MCCACRHIQLCLRLQKKAITEAYYRLLFQFLNNLKTKIGIFDWLKCFQHFKMTVDVLNPTWWAEHLLYCFLCTHKLTTNTVQALENNHPAFSSYEEGN